MNIFEKDFNDIVFVATNTCDAEKLMKDNYQSITEGMTESEKKSYDLGVENAFSILKQLNNQLIDSGTIVFWNPDVKITEEFSIDEIQRWLDKCR